MCSKYLNLNKNSNVNNIMDSKSKFKQIEFELIEPEIINQEMNLRPAEKVRTSFAGGFRMLKNKPSKHEIIKTTQALIITLEYFLIVLRNLRL